MKYDAVVGEIFDDILTLPKKIKKICITHIRFGNPDAHNNNTLATIDENIIHRLTFIDNEECLTNEVNVKFCFSLHIKTKCC